MGTGLAAVLILAVVVLIALVAVVLVVVLRAAARPGVSGARPVGVARVDVGAARAAGSDVRSGMQSGGATGSKSSSQSDAVRAAAERSAAADADRAAAARELGAAREANERSSAETERARASAAALVRGAQLDAARSRTAADAAAAELASTEERLVTARVTLDAERQAIRDEQQAARENDAHRTRELGRQAERLEAEHSRVATDADRLAGRGAGLDALERELATRARDLDDAAVVQAAELERIGGLTADAARAEVLAAVEVRSRRAAALLARDIEAEVRSTADRSARIIVTTAIQRVAAEQTAESVVSTVTLPAEDMKGRIIGREGRNIRAFEAVTGVNVIIDDTPDTVVLSCFDPIRREVARVTLQALVADGRIHPHRIEEAHAAAERDIAALCHRAAEDALLDVGITDLHPDLVDVVGRLRYRTSYGQNVLLHSVEAAHLAGVMAGELGLDPALLRRCAFLHDIGKALTHEAEGSHAMVGADLARRHGEHPDVVHAIEAHHNEVEPRTVEALLTQAADAISGGRPGARRESLEAYVTRLTRLEEIGRSHPGVDRVYAMQAGREVKVMVLPDEVDDLAAQVLAREIVKQVEDELTYPGQIRVTVIRESRATEIAR